MEWNLSMTDHTAAPRHVISAGHCRHLGATLEEDGVNFAIWCPRARSIELLLFAYPEDPDPEIITVESELFRSSYYWHVKVLAVKAGQIYAWRVREYIGDDGPAPHKRPLLIDPYSARVVFPKGYLRYQGDDEEENFRTCAKSAVIDMTTYDWGLDIRPGISLRKTVIYELHVKGFTASKTSGLSDELRGTYRGLIEKIPYLTALGITAVELLPVYQFDVHDARPGMTNYWGYSPMSFFAVHEQYSSDRSLMGPIDEFRDMVKALHRANIEVILDVVYNHTSEGGEDGPVYCFKGYDQSGYYILNKDGSFANYSGCGNTFKGSAPVVRELIQDSLIFWKDKMHVDGFRFDLAAILARGEDGEPLASSPTLLDIDANHHLADAKLIAEPWDAGGLYALGRISGSKWREWNGRFRDDVRCFMRGDNGFVKKFINRVLGSPDIYNERMVDPRKSLNFITCHDGFTLWDLVSYSHKRNDANGEHSRDGTDDNCSGNYGVEGETADPEINAVRLRQAKNFMAIALLSMGTPMLLMGDEVLRTQKGNNNAYCQDNDLSYFNWDFEKSPLASEMLAFTRLVIRLRDPVRNAAQASRRARPMPRFLDRALRNWRMQWHGVRPFQPDWSDESHSIGLLAYSEDAGVYFYGFVNAWWQDLEVELPPSPAGVRNPWFKIIDTAVTGKGHPGAVFRGERFRAGDLLKVPARSMAAFVSPNY
jgi:glycogen operon protein